jgi:hypothetical protein
MVAAIKLESVAAFVGIRILAIRLMTASKKGMSAHQLHRSTGVTYKTAWFMFRRLREAMADPSAPPIDGEGKIVVQTEMFPRQPARRFVTLDTIEYVARPKAGGVVVVGKRGAAEVHINVPDALLPELIARLKRPAGG